MALSSARQESKVDPDKGVYVEMEGIMEVRYTSEDSEFQNEAEDFFHFQQRVREIPDYFCHKDRETTQQAVFYCLVCNCDLKRDVHPRDCRPTMAKRRSMVAGVCLCLYLQSTYFSIQINIGKIQTNFGPYFEENSD